MGLSYSGRLKRLAQAKSRLLPLARPENQFMHPAWLQNFKKQVPTFAHGQTMRFGFRIGPNITYAKHVYKPNYFAKTLYSETLDMFIACRVTELANVKIIRAGGIDTYLLENPTLLDDLGHFYRNMIVDKIKNNLKAASQRFDALRETHGDLYVNALRTAYEKHLVECIKS